jgi:hypothetical protein
MKLVFLIIATAAVAISAFAQYAPQSYGIQGGRATLDNTPPEPRLVSNVIIDIKPADLDTLWLGTGNGLTRVSVLRNSILPEPPHLVSYTQAQGMGKGGVSGLLVTDSIIWASFAFDTAVGISGAGDGLVYSRDGGNSWVHLPQPRDPRTFH